MESTFQLRGDLSIPAATTVFYPRFQLLSSAYNAIRFRILTVLKFVCCTVLMMVCSCNSQHTFRAWWPAVLWNGLLLFGGTKGHIQMTMVAMSSVQIRVKNSL